MTPDSNDDNNYFNSPDGPDNGGSGSMREHAAPQPDSAPSSATPVAKTSVVLQKI